MFLSCANLLVLIFLTYDKVKSHSGDKCNKCIQRVFKMIKFFVFPSQSAPQSLNNYFSKNDAILFNFLGNPLTQEESLEGQST